MKQRQIRFSDHDDARLQARANSADLSVPQWMRLVIQRELNGIEPATVLREEFARELLATRDENHRFHEQLLEAFVALRDSLKQSQTDLLDGFQEAIAGKSSGLSGMHDRLFGHKTTP